MATTVTSGLEVPTNNNYVLQFLYNLPTILTSDLEVRSNNSELQGHNEDITINIDPTVAEAAEVPTGEPGGVPNKPPVQLIKALWTVSILTLIFVISTALYKPARGVVFGSHRLAYYLTLAAIFMSAVAEAFTAVLMSRYPDTNGRRSSWGRGALCASVGPFVAILAIGGFAFFES